VRPQKVAPSAWRADATARNAPVPVSNALPDGAYLTLYDNIRASANGRPMRSLVFAGAAPGDPVGTVVQGFAAQVRRLNQRVVIAQLAVVNGTSLLQTRVDASDAPVRGVDSLSLDLRSHACTETVRTWLMANAADFVLIEGEPLAQSLDAAMLACGCDGLVIVAAAGATPRKALLRAVERARAVECRPLGLVVRASSDRVPAWLGRVLGQN
jgi:Mrp family chromosome partitioning ATPase